MNHCKAVDAQPLLHTKRQEGGPGAALRRLPTARQRVVLSQPCGMASQIPAACYALISPRRRIVVRLARAHPATALRPQPNPPNPALPRPARPPSPSLLPTLLTPAHNTLPLRSAGKGHCACGEGQHHRPDDGLHMGHLDLLDLPGLQHMGSFGYQNCRILRDLTKIYITVF